jgi:hypothetical protein
MNKTEKELSVRRLQEDSFEMLNVPEVRLRLGSYATKLSDAVERTSFVDVDPEGFLDLKGHGDVIIPVVARHIGERAVLRAEDSGMNTRQIESITSKYDARTAKVASEKLQHHFINTQSHGELPVFEEDSGLAVTSANLWAPNDSAAVIGRPYLSMNMNSRINEKLSPVVFLHEMTHVLQNEADPIRKLETYNRDKVRRELEAYYVAAQIIMGYKDAGRQAELLDHSDRSEMDNARKIEEVRSAYQFEDDLFSPNNNIIKGLVDNRLPITRELRGLMKKSG